MNRDYYVNMFSPPPLGVTQFTGDIRYIEKLVREYEFQRNTCNSITVTDTILDDPQFIDLRNFILNFVHRYTEKVCRSKQVIELKQSWANITDTNEIHPTHMHPNSFISGVFYLMSDPEKGAPITFKSDLHRSNFSVHMIQKDPQAFYPSAAYAFGYPSVPGQLLLFSSTTSHMVPMNNSDSDRISLSFNTYPKLPFGSDEALTRVRG